MEEIIEERDNAQNDAASFEEQMIEAQDDLDAFKAAHLPRLVQGEEMNLEYGAQLEDEVENHEIIDYEMEDLLMEEENPEMIDEEEEDPEEVEMYE